MKWYARFLISALFLIALTYFLWLTLTPYWPHPMPAVRITLWLVVAMTIGICAMNFADKGKR